MTTSKPEQTLVKLLTEMGAAFSAFSPSPRLDAQLILMKVLGVDRSWLAAHAEVCLSPQQSGEAARLTAAYQAGQALPYLLGQWEFYGRSFWLTPAVLIPRPETELLIERALQGRARQAVDIGTGSGCIAVTLAAEIPDLQLIAVDLSAAALEVAQQNARRYAVQDRVRLIQSDLGSALGGGFDLLCANLPYIPLADLETLEVARREPRLSLDGGPDGLSLIRRLLADLPRLLSHEGLALLEIGAGQGDAVLQHARQWLPEADSSLQCDLAGHDRLLVIQRRG